MSDTNDETQQLRSMVESVGKTIEAIAESTEATKELAIEQMTEITTLFTVTSFIFATLPADKRTLIEDSLSDMLTNLPNQELASRMRQIVQQRLRMKLSH